MLPYGGRGGVCPSKRREELLVSPWEAVGGILRWVGGRRRAGLQTWCAGEEGSQLNMTRMYVTKAVAIQALGWEDVKYKKAYLRAVLEDKDILAYCT
jgi:hypothetical protein